MCGHKIYVEFLKDIYHILVCFFVMKNCTIVHRHIFVFINI